MRLDQEAAVKAYRAARTESSRVSVAGGATQATEKLKAVATGKYLDFVVTGWRRAKEQGLRTTQPGEIVYAAAGGWSATEIHVKACEDVTKVKVVDGNGRDRTPKGERRYVQDYTVVRSGNQWKVTDIASTPVQSFQDYGCTA